MEGRKPIDSISDYLDMIQEFDISYSTFSSPTTSKFIYRGISDISYSLIPAILRKSRDFDITSSGHTDDLHTGFVENNKYTEYATEKHILREFISHACAYIDEPTTNLYKWADYAQHYGVPTRILDWTDNPLVALYFACKDNRLDYKDETSGGKNALVWMIHTSNFDSYFDDANSKDSGVLDPMGVSIGEMVNKLISGKKTIEYPILYRPYYRDQRMSAQSSVFMVWGYNSASLDTFFGEDNYLRSNKNEDDGRADYDNRKEVIFSFEVAACQKQQILRNLDSYGINEKSLFPGLDGIGRYIEIKYRFDLKEG